MQAEVISIGDELTSGQRLDTNSQWLSERLGELGIRVLYHTTVGDDLAANVRVFREAFDRADVIVTTGGLGPTADDLTRDALAAATGTELVLDEASLAHIRALFARRRREMPERNVVQARFPAGSRPIPNRHGSAPGIELEVLRPGRAACRVFALPGVPAEMFEMWEQTASPLLQRLTGGRRIIRHHRIKCFGVGESDLEQMLPDLIARGRRPSVGITVSQATITLRITAEGTSEEECRAAMAPTIETIRACLGPLVFGEEDEELEHAVVRLLRERGRKLATIEWGSGGLLSEWLSEADPCGNVFVGGTIVRGAAAAETVLQVAGQLPAQEQLLPALAARAREAFASDYSLAVGSFPQSDSATTEPGSLYFALSSAQGHLVKATPFAGHPEILRARAVKQALNLLRLHMLER